MKPERLSLDGSFVGLAELEWQHRVERINDRHKRTGIACRPVGPAPPGGIFGLNTPCSAACRNTRERPPPSGVERRIPTQTLVGEAIQGHNARQGLTQGNRIWIFTANEKRINVSPDAPEHCPERNFGWDPFDGLRKVARVARESVVNQLDRMRARQIDRAFDQGWRASRQSDAEFAAYPSARFSDPTPKRPAMASFYQARYF